MSENPQFEKHYYAHESNCDPTHQEDIEITGLKRCNDCAGIFDKATGNGILINDRRFDGPR